MFGLWIFVQVQTFRRVPPVLPCNFCLLDGGDDICWYFWNVPSWRNLKTRPNVNSAKDWLDKLFLFPCGYCAGPAWKRFCPWFWSLGRNQQLFSCVEAILAWWRTSTKTNNQLGDPRASLLFTIENEKAVVWNSPQRNQVTFWPCDWLIQGMAAPHTMHTPLP